MPSRFCISYSGNTSWIVHKWLTHIKLPWETQGVLVENVRVREKARMLEATLNGQTPALSLVGYVTLDKLIIPFKPKFLIYKNYINKLYSFF